MTWFKVDDAFGRHPKVKALRAKGARVRSDALALWLLCGVECASALGHGGVRDGFVAESDIDDIARPLVGAALATAIVALVDVGLWEKAEGGWLFHDWSAHQPTSVSIKDKRERWRKQKAGQRGDSAPVSAPDTPADSSQDSAQESAQESAPESGAVSSRRARARAGSRPDPIPTRPDPDLGARDLDQVARAPEELGSLGRLVQGFQRRWQAKRDAHGRPLGDMWPGFGKHQARADEIAEAYAEKPEALDASLDAYFASSKPFVAQVRWNFATWASDPGRWAAEQGYRAPSTNHKPTTDEELDALFGPED